MSAAGERSSEAQRVAQLADRHPTVPQPGEFERAAEADNARASDGNAGGRCFGAGGAGHLRYLCHSTSELNAQAAETCIFWLSQ